VITMSCGHCGAHRVAKEGKRLVCCSCGRQRHDLEADHPLRFLLRHGRVLLLSAMGLPLALGMAASDAARLRGAQVQEVHAPEPAEDVSLERSPLLTRLDLPLLRWPHGHQDP
jgi:hypothetical protein